MRIYKEQESNLILPEHDDDDDDRFSSYRAVNTRRLGYKNQSVNVV